MITPYHEIENKIRTPENLPKILFGVRNPTTQQEETIMEELANYERMYDRVKHLPYEKNKNNTGPSWDFIKNILKTLNQPVSSSDVAKLITFFDPSFHDPQKFNLLQHSITAALANLANRRIIFRTKKKYSGGMRYSANKKDKNIEKGDNRTKNRKISQAMKEGWKKRKATNLQKQSLTIEELVPRNGYVNLHLTIPENETRILVQTDQGLFEVIRR